MYQINMYLQLNSKNSLFQYFAMVYSISTVLLVTLILFSNEFANLPIALTQTQSWNRSESLRFCSSLTEREREMGTLGKAIYTVGFWIRETGQALDRLGCRLQGNYYFQEQRNHCLELFITLYPFRLNFMS